MIAMSWQVLVLIIILSILIGMLVLSLLARRIVD